MQQFQYSIRWFLCLQKYLRVEEDIFVTSDSSFILGSYDEDDGPQLYMVDPSGISYVRWCQFCHI